MNVREGRALAADWRPRRVWVTVGHECRDSSYETAMNALGLLTATFHDGHPFGPTAMV